MKIAEKGKKERKCMSPVETISKVECRDENPVYLSGLQIVEDIVFIKCAVCLR